MVQNYEDFDWDEIARNVPDRGPAECKSAMEWEAPGGAHGKPWSLLEKEIVKASKVASIKASEMRHLLPKRTMIALHNQFKKAGDVSAADASQDEGSEDDEVRSQNTAPSSRPQHKSKLFYESSSSLSEIESLNDEDQSDDEVDLPDDEGQPGDESDEPNDNEDGSDHADDELNEAGHANDQESESNQDEQVGDEPQALTTSNLSHDGDQMEVDGNESQLDTVKTRRQTRSGKLSNDMSEASDHTKETRKSKSGSNTTGRQTRSTKTTSPQAEVDVEDYGGPSKRTRRQARLALE